MKRHPRRHKPTPPFSTPAGPLDVQAVLDRARRGPFKKFNVLPPDPVAPSKTGGKNA